MLLKIKRNFVADYVAEADFVAQRGGDRGYCESEWKKKSGLLQLSLHGYQRSIPTWRVYASTLIVIRTRAVVKDFAVTMLSD
jgi:hypothetical protein